MMEKAECAVIFPATALHLSVGMNFSMTKATVPGGFLVADAA